MEGTADKISNIFGDQFINGVLEVKPHCSKIPRNERYINTDNPNQQNFYIPMLIQESVRDILIDLDTADW